MSSVNESMLEEIPSGGHCYLRQCKSNQKCNCEFDCNCKGHLIKKLCPYHVYIDNGLTKCTLLNITSDEDEDFAEERKVCGFNELDEEILH